MHDKCPTCGSGVQQILSGEDPRVEFMCGSVVRGFGTFSQKPACSVIRSLRNKILSLEQWKTVVLHNLDLMFDEGGNLIWKVGLPIPADLHDKSIQDSFDEEVRKKVSS